MLCLYAPPLKFWFQTDLGLENSASYYRHSLRSCPLPIIPLCLPREEFFFFFFFSSRLVRPWKNGQWQRAVARAVGAMDSCFALFGVHQHGLAVGSMNGEKAPCIKDPDDELMSPDDMAVPMREVLARPWIGVCVPRPLALSLSSWK